MKNLKNLLSVIVLLSFTGLSAWSQIFFKVEKPGSSKVSYLLGTHHFAPLSAVDSIPELSEAMKSVDKVYGELDMSQLNNPLAMMQMQEMLVAPADSTLDKLLTPLQLDSLRVVWDKYSGGAAPLEMLYAMKPSLLSTQLASLMAMKELPDFNALEGIDMTMQNRARELGKTVAGLETMEFQMDMLYNQPLEKQAEGLMQTVRNADEFAEKASELTAAYLAHDIDKILSLMIDAENDDPEMVEKMIYSRNDNWVRILTEEMPSESLLVVVGAGHLPGSRGVVEGLRNAGFSVTPVQ